MSTNTYIPITKTWDFMGRLRKIFGPNYVRRAFGKEVSEQTVYRWGADPTAASSYTNQRNPADHWVDILEDLSKTGRKEEAIDILNIFAASVGAKVVEITPCIPDKSDLPSEMADDIIATADFQLKINQGLHPDTVEASASHLKRDIDETCCLYRKSYEGKSKKQG